jgi:aminoglycoside phosphotransferase (APT) family kinase protein
LTRGRTAEVFACGKGRVVKLLLAGRARREIEREAAIGRIVHEAGIPTPAIHEVVECDARFGVVFERIDGPSMLDVLMTKPGLALRLAPQQLGELHARIHRAAVSPESAAALRSLPAELHRKIERMAELSDAGRAEALDHLAALEPAEGGSSVEPVLCHGDFHPANVILSPRGAVIVGSTLGPPADVGTTPHWARPPAAGAIWCRPRSSATLRSPVGRSHGRAWNSTTRSMFPTGSGARLFTEARWERRPRPQITRTKEHQP